MGNPHLRDGIDSGRVLSCARALLGQGHKLSRVTNAAGLIHAEVTDMKLIDHGVGGIATKRSPLGPPTNWVSAGEVDNHSALAIDCSRINIRVDCLRLLRSKEDLVVVNG